MSIVGVRTSRLWIVGLVVAAVSLTVAGCGSPDHVDASPELRGVATFSPDEVGQGDSWGVSVMSDGDVRIVYDVGSCGGEAQALSVARSVNASYTEDEIVLRVDGSVECEGDSTDIAFLRAAVLTLDQPVGDRSIRLEN